MEQDKSVLNKLIGKKLLIRTHYGIGTKVDMQPGDYKGVLLEYDDKFIKLEYEIQKFVDGANVVSKSIILINTSYIVTIEEYQERE